MLPMFDILTSLLARACRVSSRFMTPPMRLMPSNDEDDMALMS